MPVQRLAQPSDYRTGSVPQCLLAMGSTPGHLQPHPVASKDVHLDVQGVSEERQEGRLRRSFKVSLQHFGFNPLAIHEFVAGSGMHHTCRQDTFRGHTMWSPVALLSPASPVRVSYALAAAVVHLPTVSLAQLQTFFVPAGTLNSTASVRLSQLRMLLARPACLQDYCRNVRARPVFMLLLPLLTFCILCTCGVLGVVLGANDYEREMRDRAQSAAVDWVSDLST